jgi:uncharacterized membrane protein
MSIPELFLRMEILEQEVRAFSAQLPKYVLAGENDLRLHGLQHEIERLAGAVEQAAEELSAVQSTVNEQIEAQAHYADKFQIKILWIVVSAFITIFAGVVLAFLTNLIH